MGTLDRGAWSMTVVLVAISCPLWPQMLSQPMDPSLSLWQGKWWLWSVVVVAQTATTCW